jgi:hypothetical protein
MVIEVAIREEVRRKRGVVGGSSGDLHRRSEDDAEENA